MRATYSGRPQGIIEVLAQRPQVQQVDEWLWRQTHAVGPPCVGTLRG